MPSLLMTRSSIFDLQGPSQGKSAIYRTDNPDEVTKHRLTKGSPFGAPFLYIDFLYIEINKHVNNIISKQ